MTQCAPKRIVLLLKGPIYMYSSYHLNAIDLILVMLFRVIPKKEEKKREFKPLESTQTALHTPATNS